MLFEPNVTCMQGWKYIFKIREYGPGRELSPVNWFCTTRELGPEGPYSGIRSAGPKIGPDL